MEIIDNISRLLGDDLKRSLKPGAKLKVAASCFSMYAYEALKDELEQIEELDDVTGVYHNLELTDEMLAQFA